MNAMLTRSDIRNIRTELLTQGEANHGDYFFEMDGMDTSVAIFQGGEYITTCDTFEDLKDFIRELN